MSIEAYKYQRYHEGLGHVTPYDVYTSRYIEVIERKKWGKKGKNHEQDRITRS